MKHVALLIGATALGFAAPVLAKPGNGHGHGGNGAFEGYGIGGCPPGLAKKAIPCVPPGQAKKYGVGQALPLGVADPYSFGQIPPNLRSQYGLNPYGSYYYGNGYLYRVDPRTMLIQQVVGALLH